MKFTPSLMSCVLLCTAFLVCFLTLTQSVSIYSLIAEPVGDPTSFPVSDYATFEFTYATAATEANKILIIIDLQGTNLASNTDGTGLSNDCYIAGGLIGASETAFVPHPSSASGPKRFFIIRGDIAAEDSFQLSCRFATPALEQAQIAAVYGAIYEIPDSHSTSPITTLANDALNGYVDEAEKPFATTAPTMSAFGADVTFPIPPIYTESNVFTFLYSFQPQGRRLFNDTELAFIISNHYNYVTDKVRIAATDVLLADHYAEYPTAATDENKVETVLRQQSYDFSTVYDNFDFFAQIQPQQSSTAERTSDIPTSLKVRVYTKSTTSQFNFRSGISKLLEVPFSEFKNPLVLQSLTYDVDWVYRSNCYNGIQDFTETATDCGNPSVVSCGRCLKSSDVCTGGDDCASGLCGSNGLCEIDYGTFEISAAFSTSSYIVVVIVAICLALLL